MVSFLEKVDQYKSGILLLTGLLALIAALGLARLSVTSDTRVFFAGDDPNLLQLEAFERTYSQNNNVLFVVTAGEGRMVDEDNLQILQDLTEEAWQLPHSIRVDSLTNFPHIETEKNHGCRGWPRWNGSSTSGNIKRA